MQLARAAVIAALTFVCLGNVESASGRPSGSGVDKTHATEEKQVSNSTLSFDTSEVALRTETEKLRRLKGGDVIVDSDDRGENRFVVARILIAESPSNVWRVLTNPFEFAGKISPRMKDVEILQDTAERSVMKCKMEVFPPLIPFISYTVESDYKLNEHVQFKRISGSLKDFSGTWDLESREGGNATEVVYSMHVDPGLPVPQWIIRKAMRMELPRTLIALRRRVENSDDTILGALPTKTILAVGPIPQSLRVEKLAPQALLERSKFQSKTRTVSKAKQVSIRPIGVGY